MNHASLAVISLSLILGGCSSPSLEDEEEGVFLATIYYLREHPPVRGYRPCYEERMLKRDTTPSYIIKTDDTYGLIKDVFWKAMIRCSGDKLTNDGQEIRHQFYQPSIIPGSAIIKVDSRCGRLCGGGWTYYLQRKDGYPNWHVTGVRKRWIS